MKLLNRCDRWVRKASTTPPGPSAWRSEKSPTGPKPQLSMRSRIVEVPAVVSRRVSCYPAGGVDAVTTIGVIASMAIGAMFVFSGGAKIADRTGWLRQSGDLGVARWIAQLVPWYELALGALLLSGLARPWPAVAAVLTLAVFTWFIARRMLDGTRPPCACFGSKSQRPLGRRHLARNVALLVVAAVGIFAV